MVSAGNGALSDQDRGYIANELQGNLDALFSMANTVDGTGEYLFAGFNTGNAPYTKTQGGAQYVGDQGTKTLQVDTSRQLPINEIGSNIFGNIQTSAGQFNVRPNPSNLGGGTATVAIDTATSGSLTGNNYEVTFDNTGANFTITNKTTGSVVVPSTAYTSPTVVPVFDGMQITLSTGASAPAPGDKFSIQPGNQNIFESLTDAINLLKTPAGTAAAKLDLNAGLMQANTNLDKALNNTLSARSRIGTSLKELDNLNSAGDSVGLIYKQELSGLQDLDYAKAITELNQNQVVLQAAQQSFIKTTSLSLFNYIN
jgi:flagellar hook-associated protein 3 FlgL